MFLIKMITDRYDKTDATEQVVGYIDTEDVAIKYCTAATSRLKYNKLMERKYYTYTEIFKVPTDILEQQFSNKLNSSDLDDIFNDDSFWN